MEAGIKVGLHVMCLLWDHNSQQKDWGFLFINALNRLNKENRTAMFWAVWDECPSGTQFIFHCYRYWATILVHNSEGPGQFLHSKKGITQGLPWP